MMSKLAMLSSVMTLVIVGSASLLEEILTRNDYIHEFHFFSGDHSETYWSKHVDEYLRWYVKQWQAEPLEQ